MSVFEVIERIQELSPSAAVRYKTKRILRQPIDSVLFDEFYNSKWVELLKTNQHNDGGYGRFHSQNSKLKQVFSTTEKAIDSTKMLDIQRGNPLADKLCDYMEKILSHEIIWPDGYEANSWYKAAQPLFVASKLSNFGSNCREYIAVFDSWHTILKEAFSDGKYNADRVNKISQEIFKCNIDSSYIGLNSIYLIEFFGNMQEKISDELKSHYLKWLHNNGKNIHYTTVSLNQSFGCNYSEMFKVYFLLSKYSCFKIEFREELNWLKDQRLCDGFWDLGISFSCQKMSDDWRKRERMKIDQTVMLLQLFV